MEILLLIGAIWLLIWIGRHAYKLSFQPDRHAPNPQAGPPAPPTGPQSLPKRGEVYRPLPSGRRRSSVVFRDASNKSAAGVVSGEALEGLHDAFTGASLNPVLGLHQCTKCKVYYHAESVAVLREENAARCVACGSASILSLTVQEATTSRGRDYDPDVVTLANFRSHFDRVVTFEGTVRAVKASRRGSDYAVMFEHVSWSRGLKLVFFRGAVKKVGGATFIKRLDGRSVRVRGLLLNHRLYGPQIVISERGMILDIR